MARERLTDLVQNYPFWMIDVSPSAAPPFLVLGGPLFGFSAMTMPEVTLEMAPINPLNSMWTQNHVKRAAMGTITLSRGVRVYDDTFFEWMRAAMRGQGAPRRNLLMLQFLGMSVAELVGIGSNSEQADKWTPDAIEAVRVPARAWLLYGCLPTRYKGGADMDASSGDVSIAELDIQPRSFEEFSLGPLDAAVIAGVGALL